MSPTADRAEPLGAHRASRRHGGGRPAPCQPGPRRSGTPVPGGAYRSAGSGSPRQALRSCWSRGCASRRWRLLTSPSGAARRRSRPKGPPGHGRRSCGRPWREPRNADPRSTSAACAPGARPPGSCGYRPSSRAPADRHTASQGRPGYAGRPAASRRAIVATANGSRPSEGQAMSAAHAATTAGEASKGANPSPAPCFERRPVDGPANLLAAVQVAASTEARDQGAWSCWPTRSTLHAGSTRRTPPASPPSSPPTAARSATSTSSTRSSLSASATPTRRVGDAPGEDRLRRAPG